MIASPPIDTAVETRFWPLYEVVDGRYRLTYNPKGSVPIGEWLGMQARFAHLTGPENPDLVEQIQQQVDADWAALVERCAV